ncbi:MAG: nuclear transport factor 2 family protein [Bacteroidia bacterium]|jgi:ketosteroid isomerase-like protein|nr:nuclear transport factor 2 family protein [Bacteroidia bacterium]
MKRLLLVLFIVAMVFTSCQTKTKVLPADLTAAKVAVLKVLDTHWYAVKAKDANAIMALLTDDVLSCGTDSKEFWSKTDMSNTIKQMFADSSLKIDITIDKRVIRIAKDGNSAIALEQMFMKPYSQKIPIRNIYHLVKVNDIWQFDFTSVSFIPNNDDIGKLNKALE